MSKFICNYPWTHFEVNNPNGDVTMCCENQTVLGNVNEATLEEIWNGRPYQEARRKMIEMGGARFCTPSCPIIHGQKKYQELHWYKELPADSIAYKNAVINEEEFATHALVLQSKPRWMRFAYSYACNLDCYHCYQREESVNKLKLPESFMEKSVAWSENYQALFLFGGEPFLYKRVLRFLEEVRCSPETRLFFVTNATLITDAIIKTIYSWKIGTFSISLDAATESSFKVLRARGTDYTWGGVIANVERMAVFAKEKSAPFTISMTINSINCGELLDFVKLALSFGAHPMFSLVSNSYGTLDFQAQYLLFSKPQIEELHRQIAIALSIVNKAGCTESETSLNILKKEIELHALTGNGRARFVIGKIARVLPSPVKVVIKSVMSRR